MKINFSGEKILSLSALLISICTLFVFLYQTSLIRKQQYLSVYPHLEMGNYYTGSLNYTYGLRNTGIGPAIISEIRVKEKGKIVASDVAEYVSSKLEKKDSVWYSHSNLAKGMLIPEKEDIELIAATGKTYHSAEKLHSILNNEDLMIEIEYKSIYEESWMATNHDRQPKKLD